MESQDLRKKLTILCVTFAMFLSQPALMSAGAADYNHLEFSSPLNLSRGSLSPLSRGGFYFSDNEICSFAQKEWGWRAEDCRILDKVVFWQVKQAGTVVVEKPNSDGWVSMDEWNDASKEKIDDLWQQFVASSREQGRRSGKSIVVERWQVYPTLVRDKSYMYYAVRTRWDNRPSLTVKAVLFDRLGYVPFWIVPNDEHISGADLQTLIEKVLGSYANNPTTSYAEFKNGDKVAAVGALGVLATLLGVKYGKFAAAGLLAFALAFLKKGGFLLLALPFMALKRLFSKGGGGTG